MGDILKKPYEISIWEDILTSVPTKSGVQAYQYYSENKLGIIGSDTMTSPCRASNVVFKQNVNGSAKLTFDMYRQYYDIDQEKFIDNPWFQLLTNERKIKLNYNNQWYDFIIKEVIESSTDYKFSFVCDDLFITELAKNGYNIEFDTELENNSGTIAELTETILDGCDWQLDSENSDLISQYTDESVYEITITNGFPATKIDFVNNQAEGTPIDIPANSKILVFYSTVSNLPVASSSSDTTTTYFQFLYNTTYVTDSDRLVTNAFNCYENNAKLVKYQIGEDTLFKIVIGDITVVENIILQISVNYRGNRLVRAQKRILDTDNNKLVNLYTKTESDTTNTYYEYDYTEYASSQVVSNFCLESSDFTKVFTATGVWQANTNTVISPVILPNPIGGAWSSESTSYLYATSTDTSNTAVSIINTSFKDNIDNIFRAEYVDGSIKNIDIIAGTQLVCIADIRDASESVISNFTITIKKGETTIVEFSQSGGASWTTGIIASTISAITIDDAKDGLIDICIDGATDLYLKDIQIFKYVTNGSSFIKPGEAPTAQIIEHKVFYLPNNFESQYDLIVGQDDSAIAAYNPVYYTNYDKIRSITESKSNRFNLIQTLCETFECWARFNISHDSNGYIKLEDIVNNDGIIIGKRQIKTLVYKKYVGNNNDIGFKYGINLSSIQRTINSDKIVTKLIVEQNSNEFGTNGLCTIARAIENTPKTTFIFNFDYFIQHNLLTFANVQNDLYSRINGSLGYLYWYTEWNREAEQISNELSMLQSTTLPNLTAAIQSAKYVQEAALDSFVTAKNTLYSKTGYDYNDIKSDPPRIIGTKEYLLKLFVEANTYEKTGESYTSIYNDLVDELTAVETQIKTYKTRLNEITELKKELDQKFYEKYSRFIQEGSWISEDYYDDNLYYLDAQSVLYTSKSPEITYDIKVVEISQLEGFEAYQFNIGDKTWVEDVEFFGYDNTQELLTPYKEQVTVSEISYNLDDPTQNQITVQNYKTQFEDLFQRITATTQSVEYKSGAYSRAAMAVNTDGTLSKSVLQSSLINNALILSNANDNSVIWDNSGITITNLKNPNEIVRLVSGGILLSSNGGDDWSIGITGNGINADSISTGSLSAERISIYGNSLFPSFRWDKSGINAYMYTWVAEEKKATAFDYGKFVRFDRFGLYGISTLNNDSEFIPETLNDILNNSNARFGFVWDNFFLKSDVHNGMVKISASDDIQVLKGLGSSAKERIKIGLLNKEDVLDPTSTVIPSYGIRFKNDAEQVVLETSNNGDLWLKNILKIGSDSEATADIIIGYGPIVLDGYYVLTNDITVVEGKHYYSYNSATNTYTLVTPTTGDKPRINGWYENTREYHQVFKATDNFIVYEDGYVVAKNVEINGNGTFTGTIYATDGEFNGRIYAKSGRLSNTININDAGLIIYNDDGRQAIFSDNGINIININESLFTIQKPILTNNQYTYTYGEPLKQLYVASLDTTVVSGKTYYRYDSTTEQYVIVTNPSGSPYQQEWYELGATIESQFNSNKSSLYVYVAEEDPYRLIKDTDIFDPTITYYKYVNGTYEIDSIKTAYDWSLRLGKVYIQNPDNTYTFAGDTKYDSTKIYVIRGNLETETVFGIQDNNLVLKGTIYATAGELSNLRIKEQVYIGDNSNKIILGDNYIKSNNYNGSSSGFQILSNGTINANNLVLGTSAQIYDYLQLGLVASNNDAYIYNPIKPEDSLKNRADNLFIQAQELKIYSTGIANFGNITVNGAQSTISTNAWSLSPDVAQFHNINASGKITSSVFDSQTTRMSGGLMLFRDAELIASTTTENNKTKIVFKDSTSNTFSANDKVCFNSDFDTYYTIESTNAGYVILTTSITVPYDTNTLIKITDGNNPAPWLIGVNATTSPNYNISSNSISFNSIDIDTTDSSLTYNKEIVIGDLSEIYGAGRSGLYAKNVYLTGQLTTEVYPNTYAGINSNTAQQLPQEVKPQLADDSSNIVMWAGAKNPDDITTSSFIVTAAGSLYAQRGYFKGTIITDATITASELKTAKITGNGTSPDPALIIEDAKTGLSFKGSIDSSSTTTEIVNISTTGSKFKHSVEIIGTIATTNGINIGPSSNQLNLTHTSFAAPNNMIFSGSKFTYNTEIETNNLATYNGNIILNEEIHYSTHMQYKKAKNQSNQIIGYDLYVS